MSTKKRRRPRRRDTLVLKLLILVALVLVVFEGRLIVTMITHSSKSSVTANSGADSSEPTAATQEKETETVSLHRNGSTLAGLSDFASPIVTASAQPQTPQTESGLLPTVSDPNSSAIVPKAASPVDDSYFRDAVFIGDSRMEGFRNASGITQGRFFTSVGMSLSSMTSENVIANSDGSKITVAAALSGGTYNKVYIMLGANDLGEYDWDSFHDGFVDVTRRFREIQPQATFYICSCIYVEEAKVSSSTPYVNNENVDKINSILLQVCEEEGFHYLDLNEVLSNGQGALITDASSDGIHMYGNYCQLMLEYLKSHYVADTASSQTPESESESESEGADA